MEEKNKKATQEGADKAAEAYADNREISVQDGAGYPFKEETMRAFIVGAAWQKQRLIDKACEWLKFNYVEFTDNSRLGLKINELIKDFKQAMEDKQ